MSTAFKISDIQDVAVLCITRSRDEMKLAQSMMTACVLSNYTIRAGWEAGLDYLKISSPDVVLFTAEKNKDSMNKFFGTLRQRNFEGNSYIPIIVAVWGPDISDAKAAIAIGANEFLSLPTNSENLGKAVYRAVFIGRPFIDVPAYFGPCRRRKQIDKYPGSDRRVTPWESYSHPAVLDI